eukprot:gene15909-biopygen12761
MQEVALEWKFLHLPGTGETDSKMPTSGTCCIFPWAPVRPRKSNSFCKMQEDAATGKLKDAGRCSNWLGQKSESWRQQRSGAARRLFVETSLRCAAAAPLPDPPPLGGRGLRGTQEPPGAQEERSKVARLLPSLGAAPPAWQLWPAG